LPRHDRSQPAHERTEEERARSREERARRRAGESAAGVDHPPENAPAVEYPPPASLPVEEPREIPPTVEPLPVRADAVESPSRGSRSFTPVKDGRAEPPPAPVTAEAPQAPIPAEPPPAPIPAEPPPAPIPAEPPPAPIPAEFPPAPNSVEPPPGPIPAEDPPAPIAGEPRPADDPQAPVAPLALPATQERAPGRVRQRRISPRRGRRSLPARAGALLALAAAVAAVWLLLHSLLGSGHSRTVAAPVIVKVVIPEGKTRLQIAQIAAADGLTGSYRVASRHSALLDPARYGAPRGTPDLEGFLFPATYDMDARAPVSRLVDEQLVAFRQTFGASEIRRARELHVTAYEMLTIASMVEREAQTAHDRPLIAAVMYNRLHQGMPLGIDATIYYAVELEKGIATYTHELTSAQLHIESPYNTRTHTGLPPTPISNPGLASIEAAAHPAHVGYLYYVAAADGCGEQTFSATYAQFERNAAAYQAAVAQNGGRPPTCKRK
jgi:UPF0755 protein